MKTCYLENIDLCIMDFLLPNEPRGDLQCIENRQNDEHIPQQTQNCKNLHSTYQAEIIYIDSLYPAH